MIKVNAHQTAGEKKMAIKKVKKVFFDDWGLTGIGMLCAALLGVLLLAGVANSYTGWKCSNYEKVTGFETKYISFDACYVKGSNDIFMRYDSNYKTVN
jgi:hypothetical protein